MQYECECPHEDCHATFIHHGKETETTCCPECGRQQSPHIRTATCWKCKQPGANIRTESQPPDNEAWWFHNKCYWELQDILYGG